MMLFIYMSTEGVCNVRIENFVPDNGMWPLVSIHVTHYISSL